MGLTIHYKLKAKGSEALAKKLVESLHQAAHDLPFKEIGDIVDLSGSDCDYEKREQDDPLRWLLIQAGENLRLKNNRPIGADEKADSWISVSPKRMIAFTAWPGDGCEESNIGLCQYPAEIFSPNLGTLKTRMSGWSWSSFCKTQYASDPKCGGVENFLRCHLTVIAFLDKAKELGCLDEVSDEGKFWDNRDVKALVPEIESWNGMIAAFAGQLKDTLGDGLDAPITQFSNFEQLELAGQNQLTPQTAQLAKLIQQVIKKS
jgi:hypothetical protein